jgi:serpin B
VQHQAGPWRPRPVNASHALTRRSWLTGTLGLLAAAAAPTVLASCGAGDGADAVGGGPVKVEEVTSTRTRAAGDPASLTAAVRAVQDFGTELFAALSAGTPGNLVMSPTSVHLALGMTLLGAQGRTATEMASVLHTSDAAGLAHGLNALTRSLAGCAQTIQLPDNHTATVRFDIAEGLWGQRGMTWNPVFLDALATDFGAGLRTVDYVKATEEARLAINSWVGGVTRNTIPELIAPGVLDASSRLTLVNALYLKAPWDVPFEPSRTADGSFTRGDGSTVRASFMRANLMAGYGSGPGWRSAHLDYVGDRLTMTVVLPDPGQEKLLTTLTGDRLRSILATVQPVMLDLTMPKWRTRSTPDLTATLSKLGMSTAFTPAADFSGMTSDESLAISAVLHQGYIAVDEAGTEASAAAAVVMRTTAIPQSASVTLDRPFLYVLHDRQTQTPLFIGRVNDPTG